MPPSRFTALGPLPKRQPASEFITNQRPERPPMLDPILSSTRLALEGDLDRAEALLRDGLTAYRAARKLGLARQRPTGRASARWDAACLEPAKPEKGNS